MFIPAAGLLACGKRADSDVAEGRVASRGVAYVPGVGVEPTRSFERALLRRLRLPFRHPGLRGCYPGYDAEP